MRLHYDNDYREKNLTNVYKIFYLEKNSKGYFYCVNILEQMKILIYLLNKPYQKYHKLYKQLDSFLSQMLVKVTNKFNIKLLSYKDH